MFLCPFTVLISGMLLSVKIIKGISVVARDVVLPRGVPGTRDVIKIAIVFPLSRIILLSAYFSVAEFGGIRGGETAVGARHGVPFHF